MDSTLAEICESIRIRWHRKAPNAELCCGLDVVDSADPNVTRLRREGAHFFWVAAPVLGRSLWEAHVGVVIDPSTRLARAGLHVNPRSMAGTTELRWALASIRPAKLTHFDALSASEEQWNSEEVVVTSEEGQVVLVDLAVQITALVASGSPGVGLNEPQTHSELRTER